MTLLLRHRKLAFPLFPSATARPPFCPFSLPLRGRSFVLFSCHCEVVVSFPKQSRFFHLSGGHCEVVVSLAKQSLLSGVIASLVFSSGEAISRGCFVTSFLATAGNTSADFRFVASLLAVTKRDPRGNPSFVTARSYSRFRSSLKDSSPLRGSEWPIRSVPASSSFRLRSNLTSQMVIANLVFSFGEAISTTGLLRAFGPRKDEQKESLRASLFHLVKQPRFLPESRHCGVAVLPFSYVTARSSFRFRSSLDRQESLRASFFALFLCHCEVVFSLPKQSQRFLATLRSGRTKRKT